MADSTDLNTPMKGGKGAWMAHVNRTMRANKGKSLMQVLKMAKKTYKKSKKGGASITPASAMGGDLEGGPIGTAPATTGGRRRRRGSRKSRGTRKH